MARRSYILSYDIRNPTRWRKVHKQAKGFGDPLQYSVFLCRLSDVEVEQLRTSLIDIINHREDQVMLVNLGPSPGEGDVRIEYLGRKDLPPEPGPRIL